MKGWVKLHRKLVNWEWYNDANTMRVFIHLLLKVNRKKGSYKGVEVGCGKALIGERKLALELGLTRAKVRRALFNLKTTQDIATESTAKGTVLQVINYNLYQETTHNTTTESPKEQPLTRSKEVKKKEKRIYILPNFIETEMDKEQIINEIQNRDKEKKYSSKVHLDLCFEKMLNWSESKHPPVKRTKNGWLATLRTFYMNTPINNYNFKQGTRNGNTIDPNETEKIKSYAKQIQLDKEAKAEYGH